MTAGVIPQHHTDDEQEQASTAPRTTAPAPRSVVGEVMAGQTGSRELDADEQAMAGMLKRYGRRCAEILSEATPEWERHSDRLLAKAQKEAYQAQKDAQAANRRAFWIRTRPDRYATASLSTLLPQQNPHGKVSRWLGASHVRSLLLLGPVRRGKTNAAYAIGNAANEAGIWVEAWSAAHLARSVMPKQDSTPYERASECELLILDDLGREMSNEWWQSHLQLLVEARCSNYRLRTIITANAPAAPPDADEGTKLNLAYQPLVTRYGDPIVERLVDGGGVLYIDGAPLGGAVPDW